MLTDEVWAQLDRGAALLPRAERRRVYRALAALLIAAQLGVVAWASGAIVPQVLLHDGGGRRYGFSHDNLIHITFEIRNAGWLPVTVTGWGASQPGFTMRAGEVRQIEVSYRVPACNADTGDPVPITFRVERFWGTQAVRIPLPAYSVASIPSCPR